MNHQPPDDRDLQRLDALLNRLASEPVPAAPANLESRVWREIRARGTRPTPFAAPVSWLASVLNLWREPRMAFAGVVGAAVIGISMSWIGVTTSQATSTQQALDLKVFSVEAPSLPSTLLARADTRR